MPDRVPSHLVRFIISDNCAFRFLEISSYPIGPDPQLSTRCCYVAPLRRVIGLYTYAGLTGDRVVPQLTLEFVRAELWCEQRLTRSRMKVGFELMVIASHTLPRINSPHTSDGSSVRSAAARDVF